MINSIKPISVSILNINFLRLYENLQNLRENLVTHIHIDVIDTSYGVENISFGPGIINEILNNFDFVVEIHFMIRNPLAVLDQINLKKVSRIIVDTNQFYSIQNHLNDLKQLIEVGVALKPNEYGLDVVQVCSESKNIVTDILIHGNEVGMIQAPVDDPTKLNVSILSKIKIDDNLDRILSRATFCLIMTVNPGMGGQSMIPECADKIKYIKSKYPHLKVGADGGIKLSNLKLVLDADEIVIGTEITRSCDISKTIEEIYNILKGFIR